jgi:hypothetical protein
MPLRHVPAQRGHSVRGRGVLGRRDRGPVHPGSRSQQSARAVPRHGRRCCASAGGGSGHTCGGPFGCVVQPVYGRCRSSRGIQRRRSRRGGLGGRQRHRYLERPGRRYGEIDLRLRRRGCARQRPALPQPHRRRRTGLRWYLEGPCFLRPEVKAQRKPANPSDHPAVKVQRETASCSTSLPAIARHAFRLRRDSRRPPVRCRTWQSTVNFFPIAGV